MYQLLPKLDLKPLIPMDVTALEDELLPTMFNEDLAKNTIIEVDLNGDEGFIYPDFFSISGIPVISEGVKNILSLNLKLGDRIKFFPILLKEKDSLSLGAGFYLAKITAKEGDEIFQSESNSPIIVSENVKETLLGPSFNLSGLTFKL